MDHRTAAGDFQTLVVLKARHFQMADDGEVSAAEADDYRQKVKDFKDQCIGPGVRVGIFGNIGSGAFVTAERASFLVQERRINFDWTSAQRLLHQAESVADQAAEWWPWEKAENSPSRSQRKLQEANELERSPHVDRAYDLMTATLSAVNQEHRRVLEAGATSAVKDAHSDAYVASMTVIAEDIARAETLLETAAQRRAQLTYTTGMLVGATGLGGLCLAIGAAFYVTDTAAADGAALLAGGLGAVVSVLQRMTSGTLRLDIHAGNTMLFRFGALRPAIGAIIGLAMATLFAAGLLPTISVEPNQELAFSATVGFLGGFNERFAQDMIATSSGRLSR